jgi:hypothetical protein
MLVLKAIKIKLKNRKKVLRKKKLELSLEKKPFFYLADDFKRDMDNVFMLITTPSLLGVSGVFMLGFGITQTFSLAMAGVVLSVGYSILPILKQLSLQPYNKKNNNED